MNGDIKARVRTFPAGPGVYRMLDKTGSVIYVGKAKDLRSRVRSYFSSNLTVKTEALMARVADIEYVVTGNEYEALLLENNLIKELQPRYNINLKDGKSYPVIRITADEYPRVFRTRRIVDDGSEYYGPFTNVNHLERYLELIDQLFPLRKCRHPNLRPRPRPCLYHHIGRCAGVCAGKMSRDAYMERVDAVRDLLAGKTAELLESLRSEMQDASDATRFERAAQLRDAIRAIEAIEAEQRVTDFDPELRDYIGFASRGDSTSFVVFQMRGGSLVGSQVFHSRSASEDEESFVEFALQFYGAGAALPNTVYTSASIAGAAELEHYFSGELGAAVRISGPKSSRDAAILRLSTENARQELDKRLSQRGNLPALTELAAVLDLPAPPLLIEGFDIAHVGGKNTVASMVSFANGVPDTSSYRKYRIRTLKAGEVDDFAAMREVIARRYTRVKNERKPRPDLILVDGGKGQVGAAREILIALGLESVPLVGLAKRNEEIFLPDRSEAVQLPEGSLPLRLLQYVRDEAHRFATGYRANLQKSDLVASVLERVPGIGAKRGAALRAAFSTLESIVETPTDIVARSTGLSPELAARVQEYIAEYVKGAADSPGSHRA